MSKSKFDAVLGQRRTQTIEPIAVTETTRQRELAELDQEKKGPGRPPGKRTNPAYQQVTVYIPRALHDKVKIALIQEGRKEFSELVEELLTDWNNRHTEN
jgi:hypothetical protein